MHTPLLSEAVRAFEAALAGDDAARFEDPRWNSVRKMLTKAGEEFEDALLWRLREAMPQHLAHAVEQAAVRSIEAVLNGDEKELRRWLSCDAGSYTGRAGEGAFARSTVDAHPIIHGKLFETGAVALRKQVVDAHADLLKNERILDLEDQLASAVAQFNKLQADFERYRQSH